MPRYSTGPSISTCCPSCASHRQPCLLLRMASTPLAERRPCPLPARARLIGEGLSCDNGDYTMTRSIYAILTGILVVSLPSARASAELPGDAATLVQKFQEEADAIQSKANQAIDTRKQKLVEDLKALRDSYAKAGKYDEA